MDKEAFVEDIYDAEYAAWALKRTKKHFNKYSCDFFSWRYDNDVLMFVTNEPTAREFRTLFAFKETNARSDSFRSDLVDLFEEVQKAKELFKKKKLRGRSSVIASENQKVEVDDVKIPVEEDQRVIVVDQ